MEQAIVSPQVQYIVNDQGRRTAVVLRIEDYRSLQARASSDPDVLTGLDESELRALAEGMLSPSHQARLTELLQHNHERDLDEAEQDELDQLLAHVDSMNVLKARALRTLQLLKESARGARHAGPRCTARSGARDRSRLVRLLSHTGSANRDPF